MTVQKFSQKILSNSISMVYHEKGNVIDVTVKSKNEETSFFFSDPPDPILKIMGNDDTFSAFVFMSSDQYKSNIIGKKSKYPFTTFTYPDDDNAASVKDESQKRFSIVFSKDSVMCDQSNYIRARYPESAQLTFTNNDEPVKRLLQDGQKITRLLSPDQLPNIFEGIPLDTVMNTGNRIIMAGSMDLRPFINDENAIVSDSLTGDVFFSTAKKAKELDISFLKISDNGSPVICKIKHINGYEVFAMSDNNLSEHEAETQAEARALLQIQNAERFHELQKVYESNKPNTNS